MIFVMRGKTSDLICFLFIMSGFQLKPTIMQNCCVCMVMLAINPMEWNGVQCAPRPQSHVFTLAFTCVEGDDALFPYIGL